MLVSDRRRYSTAPDGPGVEALILGNSDELAVLGIECENFASFDLVDPAVQMQVPARQPRRDRRQGSQIFELNEHVFFDGGREQPFPLQMTVVVADNAAGRLGVE